MSGLPPLHDALLALGSNLGDRNGALAAARAGIAAWPRCRVLEVGDVVETPPWGPVSDQPPFLNQAMRIQTAQSALAAMDLIDWLEHDLGRRRASETPLGPRPIDIDLLLFDKLVVRSPRITLPHPGLADRPYLLGLVEGICPDLPIPPHGRTAGELLASL